MANFSASTRPPPSYLGSPLERKELFQPPLSRPLQPSERVVPGKPVEAPAGLVMGLAGCLQQLPWLGASPRPDPAAGSQLDPTLSLSHHLTSEVSPSVLSLPAGFAIQPDLD